MAVFDVREGVEESITEIVFAEGTSINGLSNAYKVEEVTYGIAIWSSEDEYVRVHGVEHAQNLIKALNKAIELGGLK